MLLEIEGRDPGVELAPLPRPGAARGSYRVETVASLDGMRSLRREWEPLLCASAADGLFLTWDWMWECARHLCGEPRLRLLTVRHAGELVGVAPLQLEAPARWRGGLPQRLEFLGSGAVGSDYLDLIVRRGLERPVLSALADHLDAGEHALRLGQVRGSGSAVAQLAQELEGRGFSAVQKHVNLCPFIDLDGLSWDGYVRTLGPSHRQNLRRRLRKLEARHEVSFEPAAAEGDLASAFDSFLSLHASRFRGRHSNAFHTPALVAFHRDMLARALRRGWLRLFLLRLDGRPAAAFYGFRYRDRFFYYQSGFDPARARDAVALVSMGLAIRQAIAEGARVFDMLHGGEPYKLLWAKKARPLVKVDLYPPSLPGRLLRHACGLRARAGAVRRLLPERTRTLGPWAWAMCDGDREPEAVRS